MSAPEILAVGAWSGLFAAAMAIVFCASFQELLPGFCAGFVARVVRDWLMQLGLSQTAATSAAAAAVVIVVAAALIRRRGVSPVVLLSGLVPLGAARALFNAIIAFLRMPSLKGEDLAAAPAALISDISVVFRMTLATALGVALGVLIVQASKRAREALRERLGNSV